MHLISDATVLMLKVICGFLAVIVSVLTVLLTLNKLRNSYLERRKLKETLEIFTIDAYIDPAGVVEIQVSNVQSDSFEVNEADIVRDKSKWLYFLRTFVRRGKLEDPDLCSWHRHFQLPVSVPSRSSRNLHGEIDLNGYPLLRLKKMKALRPMLRVNVAAKIVLVNIQTTDNLLSIPGAVTRDERGIRRDT